MYLVREKKSQAIIHVSRLKYRDNRDPKEVYANFDNRSMELLKSRSGLLPSYYKVDEDGFILPMTVADKLDRNLILPPNHKKVKDGEIVSKSLTEQVEDGQLVLDAPFEYITKDDTIGTRTVAEILDEQALATQTQCDNVIRHLNNKLQEELAESYDPSDEIALMKDYLIWLDDGSPKNDDRPEAFRKMKDLTLKLRAKYSKLKAKVEAIRATLPAESGKPVVSKAGLPDKTWTNADIKLWLTEHELPFAKSATKVELLRVVKTGR